MAPERKHGTRPITVSLDPETIKLADRIAREEERSRSQVVRRAIRFYAHQEATR